VNISCAPKLRKASGTEDEGEARIWENSNGEVM